MVILSYQTVLWIPWPRLTYPVALDDDELENVNSTMSPRGLNTIYSSHHWIFWSFLGVDTDELDSNIDDYEEETIEFFINEEIIPIGDL